jgi:Uma2 family endonuclease
LTGPAAVRLRPDVVREPDLFVLSPEELPKAKGVPLEVHPALVVEVLSSATRSIDLREKAEDYALAEIPEYWAVDPEPKEVVVHRLELEGKRFEVERLSSGRVESRAVPGFWVEAGWLFQDPLPPVAECLNEVFR